LSVWQRAKGMTKVAKDGGLGGVSL